MHFNKILLSLTVAVLALHCSAAAASLKARRRMRSAQWRIFPLYQRKMDVHGRSMASAPVLASSDDASEGRGLMKKFMMFKSMFQQPENNIIIITQPAATTTDTTSPTTGTTTTSAAGDGGTANPTGAGRDDSEILGGAFNIKDDQLLDSIQPLLSNNSRNRKPKPVRRSGNKGNNRKRNRRRNQRQRNQTRKRLEQISSSISKKPSLQSNAFSILGGGSSGGGGGGGGGSNNSGNSPSGINSNASARIQNIMNALRQQTPIVYN